MVYHTFFYTEIGCHTQPNTRTHNTLCTILKVRRGEQIWKLAAQRSEFLFLDGKAISQLTHLQLSASSPQMRLSTSSCAKCMKMQLLDAASNPHPAFSVLHPAQHQSQSCWSRSVMGVPVPVSVLVPAPACHCWNLKSARWNPFCVNKVVQLYMTPHSPAHFYAPTSTPTSGAIVLLPGRHCSSISNAKSHFASNCFIAQQAVGCVGYWDLLCSFLTRLACADRRERWGAEASNQPLAQSSVYFCALSNMFEFSNDYNCIGPGLLLALLDPDLIFHFS